MRFVLISKLFFGGHGSQKFRTSHFALPLTSTPNMGHVSISRVSFSVPIHGQVESEREINGVFKRGGRNENFEFEFFTVTPQKIEVSLLSRFPRSLSVLLNCRCTQLSFSISESLRGGCRVSFDLNVVWGFVVARWPMG